MAKMHMGYAEGVWKNVKRTNQTTTASGNLTLGNEFFFASDGYLVCADASGHLTMPFRNGVNWFVKILNLTTLQPEASTNVDEINLLFFKPNS